MFRLFAILIGYGFGMIQFAYILGKLQGIDIRDHGSGNSGANNALRVMGVKKGLFVFFVDASKCALAFFVAMSFFNDYGILPGIYAGLGAVLGHCFPFYLKFKGGKGISCTVGLMIAINPFMGITIIAVGASVLIFTRYVSLTSLIVTILLPFFLYLYNFLLEAIIVSIIIAAICTYLHRGNISRLIKGTERQLGKS